MTHTQDMLERLVAMEKDAVLNTDAVSVSFYEQETPPYWTNKIEGVTVATDSQDFRVYTYRVKMRLILAYITEDYPMLAEQRIQEHIPAVLDYFAARIRLQCTAFPTPMVDIDPCGAMITDVIALPAMTNDGIGAQMVGADFFIEVPIEVQITQAY